jgi:hypothetical protein
MAIPKGILPNVVIGFFTKRRFTKGHFTKGHFTNRHRTKKCFNN